MERNRHAGCGLEAPRKGCYYAAPAILAPLHRPSNADNLDIRRLVVPLPETVALEKTLANEFQTTSCNQVRNEC